MNIPGTLNPPSRLFLEAQGNCTNTEQYQTILWHGKQERLALRQMIKVAVTVTIIMTLT